jgi:hypothetical protein
MIRIKATESMVLPFSPEGFRLTFGTGYAEAVGIQASRNMVSIRKLRM